VKLLAALLLAVTAHAAPAGRIVFAADRIPQVSGDVYRVDATGRVANLTHSPWQETQPLVAPDGKLVAFFSDRDGGSLWTIGVDGRGLRRLPAVSLPPHAWVQMAWSPDGRRLAVVAGNALFLTATGAGARVVARASELGSPAWSADGRLLTVPTTGEVDAYTADGRRAWSVTSGGGPVGWSKRGLFATGPYDGAIHVYDEQGRQRFAVAAERGLWSPDGSRLAAVGARRLDVRSTTGAVVLRTTLPLPNYAVEWDGANAIAFEDGKGLGHRVDIRSGKVTNVDVGALGLNTRRTGTTFAVRSGTRAYTHVPGCFDDGGPVAGIASLQRVAHSTSLVYQSYCPEAFANLYSVRPDGTGLTRLTNVQENQVRPVLSPDGTRIAYGQSDAVGLSCKGCPESLHVANLDGTGAVTLTSPPDCTFDDSPSWSPDGTLIVYSHSGCDTAPDAFVVPAAGGTPKDLHLPAWTVAWGPARIGYANGGTAPTSMWTALPDGSDRRWVRNAGAGLPAPAWSADGRLAYVVGTTAIVNGTKVPLPFAAVKSIAWAPDGTRFLVAAKPKGAPTFDLYTVRADGTDVQRLTSNLDVSGGDWR